MLLESARITLGADRQFQLSTTRLLKLNFLTSKSNINLFLNSLH